MPGYSKLGRAIMRAKSLSPVVSQSRIKVKPRKPKPMDHTQALVEALELARPYAHLETQNIKLREMILAKIEAALAAAGEKP